MTYLSKTNQALLPAFFLGASLALDTHAAPDPEITVEPWGMTLTYDEVPEGFSPPLPDPLPDHIPVYIRMEQADTPGQLLGAELVNYTPGELGVWDDDYDPEIWEEIWKDLRLLVYRGSAPPHPEDRYNFLICKYFIEPRKWELTERGYHQSPTFPAHFYYFWYQRRPPWADPERLKTISPQHPLLNLKSVVPACPGTRAGADPEWAEKMARAKAWEKEQERQRREAEKAKQAENTGPSKRDQLFARKQAEFVKACTGEYGDIRCTCAFKVLSTFHGKPAVYGYWVYRLRQRDHLGVAAAFMSCGITE